MVFLFFFFQAEDGIRDDLVTGVQTCALPISCCLPSEGNSILLLHGGHQASVPEQQGPKAPQPGLDRPGPQRQWQTPRRWEERRVGKECRSRWSAEHCRKKQVVKEIEHRK